jgi:hypothetical protein
MYKLSVKLYPQSTLAQGFLFSGWARGITKLPTPGLIPGSVQRPFDASNFALHMPDAPQKLVQLSIELNSRSVVKVTSNSCNSTLES